MRHAIAPLTLALAALLPGAPSWAGAAASGFAVSITLNNASGPQPGQGAAVPQSGPDVCFSSALGGLTRARVEVTCSAGRFVAIEALPGRPFAGVHGGAFRYVIPFVADNTVWGQLAAGGQGTVTMLRVYDLTRPEGPGNLWWDRPLEMRVSF